MTNCPKCNVSLIAGEIPAESRHLFGGATHFKRELAHVINDRTAYYSCPDCGATWGREAAATASIAGDAGEGTK